MGDRRGFCWGNLREREHLESQGVDGDTIKMDLHEVGLGLGMDWSGLRYGQVAGCGECGNERVP